MILANWLHRVSEEPHSSTAPNRLAEALLLPWSVSMSSDEPYWRPPTPRSVWSFSWRLMGSKPVSANLPRALVQQATLCPTCSGKGEDVDWGVETAILPAAEVVEGGACAGLSLRHADDPSTRRPFKNRCWRPRLPTVPHRSEPVRLLAGLALSSVAISGRIRSPRCSSIVCPCPKGARR
jgi:hypothetical protein